MVDTIDNDAIRYDIMPFAMVCRMVMGCPITSPVEYPSNSQSHVPRGNHGHEGWYPMNFIIEMHHGIPHMAGFVSDNVPWYMYHRANHGKGHDIFRGMCYGWPWHIFRGSYIFVG